MLDLQVLVLALIPVFSGVLPGDGKLAFSPETLLGLEQPLTVDYVAGTWKCSDDFFRWGATDKERARVQPFRGNAVMSLLKDGTFTMVNLFRPHEGRWELTDRGIRIHDELRPERGHRVIPLRKRDNDRMWLLFPFAGGAAGIGMVRVPEGDPVTVKEKARKQSDPTPGRPEPVKNSVPTGMTGRAADMLRSPAEPEPASTGVGVNIPDERARRHLEGF